MQWCIRPARPEDAQQLTQLALAAKAVWGYDEAFMRQCKDERRVTSEMLRSDDYLCLVAEIDGALAGYASLVCLSGKQAELDALFVEPDFMRRGVGLALWRAVVDMAMSRQIVRIEIQSDPHALPFYLAVGCQHIGDRASQSIPDRDLPLLDYRL